MAHPRLEASSIRNQYAIHLQVGLALSLAFLLAAVHLPSSLDRGPESEAKKQETIDLRRVQSTGKEQTPPVPPTPPVPLVVPREKIVEPPNFKFDLSLSLNAPSSRGGGVVKKPDCGGPQALREKTYYPPSALMEGLEGHVLVEFVVDKNGDIESPKVADGSREVFNQAALRAVRRLECTPGRKRSRPVRVKVTKMVVFVLPKRMSTS